MNLGEKIFTARKKAGLSQTDLADAVGVSRQSVSKWETGESAPEAGNLLLIAKALNVTTDWLLSEDDEPAPLQDTAPDWVDRLPGRIRTLIKQYGWIYCAKETVRALIGLIVINVVRVIWFRHTIPDKMPLWYMLFPQTEFMRFMTLPFNFGSAVCLILILFWGILWILLKKGKKTERT